MIKHVNITFVFQKEYRGSEENYHLGNILPVISKIFEKLLYNQMTPFFYQFLSMFQRSFYKRANAQRCFLPLYKSGRQQLTLTTSLMFFGDLLKAFNRFPHKFIIAGLSTYGLNLLALNPIQNYLANVKQNSQGKLFIQLFE